jgi:hypothetical protein
MIMIKSEVDGQPPAICDDLVQSADQNICERQHYAISELESRFP